MIEKIKNNKLLMQIIRFGIVGGTSKEFIVFIVLSVIGLGLNSLIMYVSVDLLHIHEMISKIIATAIVMVYNFITRKIFIEK